MRPSFEHIAPTSRLSWKHHVRRGRRFDFLWHYHAEYELTLITKGGGARFVGDSMAPYRSGDLTLIGPELPHTYASTGIGNEAVIVQFRRDFLGADFFDRPDFREIARLLDRAGRGLSFDAGGPAAEVLRGLTRVSAGARTLRLLDALLALSGSRGKPLASPHYVPARLDDGRLDAVCRFLNVNYSRRVGLAEAAAVAHLSPPAFSRFFHRVMGRTMTAYLNELRIGAACRLLVDTDLPIADIAARSGFGNLSHFNRRFRLLRSATPREYRNAFQPTR